MDFKMILNGFQNNLKREFFAKLSLNSIQFNFNLFELALLPPTQPAKEEVGRWNPNPVNTLKSL